MQKSTKRRCSSCSRLRGTNKLFSVVLKESGQFLVSHPIHWKRSKNEENVAPEHDPVAPGIEQEVVDVTTHGRVIFRGWFCLVGSGLYPCFERYITDQLFWATRNQRRLQELIANRDRITTNSPGFENVIVSEFQRYPVAIPPVEALANCPYREPNTTKECLLHEGHEGDHIPVEPYVGPLGLWDKFSAARENWLAEIMTLRRAVLTTNGDNLCWFNPEGAENPVIPPWPEFSASCARFHEQIATVHGVNTAGRTLAQLESENLALRLQVLELEWASRAELRLVK